MILGVIWCLVVMDFMIICPREGISGSSSINHILLYVSSAATTT